jgi:dihydroorotate dehydrogenase (NAD+) catalytic subunit
MVDLTVQIGNMNLRNPVLLASGTCGFGRELADYVDFSGIGGICSKGLTVLPREGNPGCRVAETPSGMLNSVGLQNPGLDVFLERELPFMRTLDTAVIANIAGHSTEDYLKMTEVLGAPDCPVDALELNLSCPNVKEGCMTIGATPEGVYQMIKAVRGLTDKPLWVKLTPNVTSITATALAAEEAGGDAVVLINTLLGMAIDIRTRRPILMNNTGGLSGPAIKPVAIRMISECYRVLSIPIIGVGGIMSAEDVIEFMIAGASAVEIGTASLLHPSICEKIVLDLEDYLLENKIHSISELTGTLRLWES